MSGTRLNLFSTIKGKLRLSSVDDSDEASETIEQEVFLGDLPWMTHRGTFIYKWGRKSYRKSATSFTRCIFGQSIHPNGTQLYSARVIPFKGSWIELPQIFVMYCGHTSIERRKSRQLHIEPLAILLMRNY